MFTITIDGHEFEISEGKGVLEAALNAGVYIPHLCSHPATGPCKSLQPVSFMYQHDAKIENDLSSEFMGCNLCLVEIQGKIGPVNSCDILIADGMVIHTDTVTVKEKRRRNLALLIERGRHPTTCITCGMAEGCDRNICSMHTDDRERCCWKYFNCEFREVAKFIGLDDERVRSGAAAGAFTNDHPVLNMDYRLCVGCMRCVVACRDISKRAALGFVHKDGNVFVGSTHPELEKSGCKFCMVCADVCPTGAIRPKNEHKKKSKARLELPASILPPVREEWLALNENNLSGVPEEEGVFRLRDENKVVIQITGTTNLRDDLSEELNSGESVSFNYELDPMFMMRERQLLQEHLKKYGDLPKRNKEIDELF